MLLESRMYKVADFIKHDTTVYNYILEKEKNKNVHFLIDSTSFFLGLDRGEKFLIKNNFLKLSDTLTYKQKVRRISKRESFREKNFKHSYFDFNKYRKTKNDSESENMYLTWDYDEENNILIARLKSMIYLNQRLLYYIFIFNNTDIKDVLIIKGTWD